MAYSYLDCVVLKRLIRIDGVLHRYAVELTFVDVSHTIVFSALRGGNLRFEIEFESKRRMPVEREDIN